MQEKMRYLLRLLIIILLNICAIALAGHIIRARPVSVPVRLVPEPDETPMLQATADSDYYLLARLIEAECSNEPYAGQVAVGAVVLNRVRHSSFPGSIAGVIYQPGAFSSVTDGRVGLSAGQSACRAAKDALNGLDPSGGAVYYYNAKKSAPGWLKERPVVKIIGSRTFCK